MESKNPVFNQKTLEKMKLTAGAEALTQHMTVQGSINKTGILFLLMIATSVVGWQIAETSAGVMLAMGACLLNLALCLVIVFKKELSPQLAPAYALVEGFAIGAISAWAEQFKPGIAGNAMMLTFSCVSLMLGLYHFKIVRVTDRLKSVVVAATLAIAITYIFDLVLGLTMGTSVPMIHEGGVYGIGFSLLVIGIASLNLLLDFDMIEKASALQAPKYMEWYAGFALLVTIVWLYVEMLRLLSKMSKK
jgi:uncharacterized YccA/Bax inhibitor family protein